ncbi:restriction endonuclease subunit S [Pseudoalteromonas sp. 1181_04]
MGSKYLMKIRDIAEVFDGPHATPKKIDVGPYFLSISSLVNGQLDLSKSAHLSEEQFKKWTKRVTPQVGDVLFSYETRLGEAALMPAGVTACLGRRMGLLRPDQSKVLPEYLLYAYLSPVFQQEIKKRTIHGATVERISLRELPDFDIHIPEIKTQRKVINTLNAINNKISLNKTANQTLEQMAQALFKSWFVDFDPVFDNLLASVDFNLDNLENRLPDELIQKAQRRLAALNSLKNAAECKASLIALAHELQAQLPTKEATHAAVQILGKTAETPVKANVSANPHILAQHANTHAHFPSEFEHNEQLGWIPKGWTVSNVGAEFDVIMGQSPPGSSYNEEENGIPFFQGKTDYGFRFPTNRIYCTLPKRLAKKNDTLVSVRAPVGTINLAGEDCTIGRGLAAVKHKSGSVSFTYYAMNDLANHFAVFEGEGTVFGSINQKDFNAITQLSYPLELISCFSSICSNWDNKIEQISHQTIVLTKIRDTLLPKLISGELQIPDAATVEEIVD